MFREMHTPMLNHFCFIFETKSAIRASYETIDVAKIQDDFFKLFL